MKNKKWIISTSVVSVIALVYTILIAFVDRNAIGANDSVVGFSKINKYFLDLLKFNNTFYNITKYTGIIIILIAVIYMIIALIELIKRKKYKEVDSELIFAGVFYIALIIIYFVFELLKINYRPILMDGVLEPSYPSSHTMLAVFICVTALLINKKIIKNTPLKITIDTITIIIGLVTVIGRVISGVHWITDIIGGILISTALVLGYVLAIKIAETKKNDKQSVSNSKSTDKD